MLSLEPCYDLGNRKQKDTIEDDVGLDCCALWCSWCSRLVMLLLERFSELSPVSRLKVRADTACSLQLVRDSRETLSTEELTKESSVRTLKLLPSVMRTFKLYN